MRLFTALFIFLILFGGPELYSQMATALHTDNDEGPGRTVKYYYRSDGFQKAYQDAADGDTIYLPGGTFQPPPLIVKQLTIYGTGHYPQATAVTGKTIINGNLIFGAGADNVHIEGVEVTGGIDVANNVSVNYLMVSRSRIGQSIYFRGDKSNPCFGVTFDGCVLAGNLFVSNLANSGVFNSILMGYISSSEANTFSNNIIYYNSSPVTGSSNNSFNNNIFRVSSNTLLVSSGSEGNYFRYNIIGAASPNYGTGAQATGNYTGVEFSSVFVSQSGTSFSYDNDYNLISPGTYTGTDESQVGIYGGIFPYREGAVPVTPHITGAGVSPRSDAEGNIQIEISVEAQERP
jgi:hypothetical protein